MAYTKRNMLEIANAQILFPNFAGREKTAMVAGRQKIVNEAGKRNFNVALDPEKSDIYWNGERVTNPDFGQELANLGFNVIVRPGREEGDPVQYRLPVAIGFGSERAPELYLVSNGKKVLLDEESVGNLDYADIIRADVVINNGRSYISNSGEEKVKAWCNEGYFTIAQSRFANQYGEE